MKLADIGTLVHRGEGTCPVVLSPVVAAWEPHPGHLVPGLSDHGKSVEHPSTYAPNPLGLVKLQIPGLRTGLTEPNSTRSWTCEEGSTYNTGQLWRLLYL